MFDVGVWVQVRTYARVRADALLQFIICDFFKSSYANNMFAEIFTIYSILFAQSSVVRVKCTFPHRYQCLHSSETLIINHSTAVVDIITQNEVPAQTPPY